MRHSCKIVENLVNIHYNILNAGNSLPISVLRTIFYERYKEDNMRLITRSDFDEIIYELTRKTVKNVNLRIDVSGNVKVSASRRVPIDYIEGFMRQKQALIVSAVCRAEENRPLYGWHEPHLEVMDRIRIVGKSTLHWENRSWT